MSTTPILPIPDPTTGAPTCPIGYTLDAASQLCVPTGSAPNLPPITSTTFDSFLKEFDPVQGATNFGIGLAKSNVFAKAGITLWKALISIIDWTISEYFDALDRIIAYVADQVGQAIGRDRPGFWILIGSLISDLLGVNLNGAALFDQLKTRGTLPAMEAVGSGLIDLLVGEFTQTASGKDGNVAFSTAVDPSTGLPQATLSPLGGLLACKALMGFVLASAIRQANVDGLVDAIPFGFGHIFEKYSEGVRTNLGIGRMMRFALKPIFQDLVATPTKWAINKQYRPTLFSAEEAIRDRMIHPNTDGAFRETMARHGYDVPLQDSIFLQKQRKPSYDELRILKIQGLIDADTLAVYLHAEGFPDEAIGFIDQARDLQPARAAILRAAEAVAERALTGKIPVEEYKQIIDGLSKTPTGKTLLSQGEVDALKDLPIVSGVSPRHKNLGIARLMLAYEEGIITLTDFEADLTQAGYDANQVQELVLMLLVKAKADAEKAAAAAAKKAAAAAAANPTPQPPATPAP
jgi:hypothetical protein